jgi:HEAT repeat protein
MRHVWSLVLLVLAGGCHKAEPPLAHGKPVGEWVAAVHGPNVQARQKAVRVLGNVGGIDPAVVPALAEALGDRDAGVRAEAALALLKIGPPARPSESALATAAQYDANPIVRHHAARALLRVRGESP